MKKFLTLFVLISFLFLCVEDCYASTRVRGYIKKNGTYVRPYNKTSADKTKFNNYSTKGSYNPYTGKKGSASPYKTIKRKKY